MQLASASPTSANPASADPFEAATGEACRQAALQPNWAVPNDLVSLSAKQFHRQYGIDPVVGAQLLKGAGTYDEVLAYIYPRRKDIVSPEVTVPGMNAAAAALSEAIDNGQRVAIFADYDPDGTTACEVLQLALDPYIPGRDALTVGYADARSGFGLTNEFVDRAHADGATVLVTVDCGSTQVAQVAYARSLGMTVLVVDHHNYDEENPADHHLNPHLHGTGSENTGAQLAWKLGCAVQMHREGTSRQEHWGRAMYLAGFGARADMGPGANAENRAFFRTPLTRSDEVIPAGVRLLAERLGEDPETPAGPILTSAVMNLPKRTRLVSAEIVGDLLAAKDPAEAESLVDSLVGAYEEARPVRHRMNAAARAAAESTPNDNRTVRVVLDDDAQYADYSGYTGLVANDTARGAAKPVVCFAPTDVDHEGRMLYKFSMRTPTSVKPNLGQLIDDEQMQEACRVNVAQQSGETSEQVKLGGHQRVVSGTCYQENIDSVADRLEEWASSFPEQRWVKPKWSGPEAYLSERRISAARLKRAEADARLLAPFSRDNRRPQTSVVGTITDVAPDPDRPEDYQRAVLRLPGKATRQVIFKSTDQPPAEEAEFVIELGEPGPYFIRNWFTGAPPSSL